MAVLAGDLSSDCEEPNWFPITLDLAQDSFPGLAAMIPEFSEHSCPLQSQAEREREMGSQTPTSHGY